MLVQRQRDPAQPHSAPRGTQLKADVATSRQTTTLCPAESTSPSCWTVLDIRPKKLTLALFPSPPQTHRATLILVQKPFSKHKFDITVRTTIACYWISSVEIFGLCLIHRIPWPWLRETNAKLLCCFKDTLEQYQAAVLGQIREHIFHGNVWTSAEDCVTSWLDPVKSVRDVKAKGVCCFSDKLLICRFN